MVMEGRKPAVYMMASKQNGTLYIGVTSDLIKRVWEHKEGFCNGFCKKYHVKQLVYFEMHADMYSAITREKQLKVWKREWKIKLIESKNPKWLDLWQEII
jgi:putative endonuclease